MRNIDFCKTQVVALWENISSFLDRVNLKDVEHVDSKRLMANLYVNTENQEFLTLLGRMSEGSTWLFSGLKKIHAERGSIHLNFRDSTTNQRQRVVLDFERVRRQLRRYKSEVGNALRQFVDWVLQNKRTVITCFLVAGVVTITLFAGVWIGVAAIPLAKLVIPLVIAIICLIAETVSAYGDFSRFRRGLKRRGIVIQ